MESSPAPSPSLPPQPPKRNRLPAFLIVVILLVGLFAGGFIGFAITYSDFNQKLSTLQSQIGRTQGSDNGSHQTVILNDNVSLSNLYQQVKSSVVVVQDLVPQYSIFRDLSGYSLQQGSGFVTQVNNQVVIVTNNHVVQDAINVTVTFSNGNSYPAKVLGSDAQADLAVLTITPMPNGLTPLLLSQL